MCRYNPKEREMLRVDVKSRALWLGHKYLATAAVD
jgi:hypothetical protein